MEATPFANGYKSKIYSERQVPDICGLCGLEPIAAYIMLPVEPGGSTMNKALEKNIHKAMKRLLEMVGQHLVVLQLQHHK